MDDQLPPPVRLYQLATGHYVLQFGGSSVINAAGNTFTEEITYKITVTP